jgi:23S rRNA (cytidine2498-2'-O)-methyltransferase
MESVASAFVFALTNRGAENPLKHEVAGLCPTWRAGYQRRGFVTFKSAGKPFGLSSLEHSFCFARRLCLSVGKAASGEGARDLLATAAPGCLIHEAGVTPEREPRLGEIVGTVVSLGEAEWWAGLHRHGPLVSPDPCGLSVCELPEDAPSRAWLKLEEATRFFGLRFDPRDVVVELGCAPGGVILALLRRGISCIGVDPALLAPVVMAHAVPEPVLSPRAQPWVYHCRKPAALVSKRDLAGVATWFMSDMNQSPAVALKECARFTRMCPSIRSALITLKLTDLAEATEKPTWLEAMRAMGFADVRLQQLSVHHRELVLLGLGRTTSGR